MEKELVKNIVDKVYPLVKQFYGKSTFKNKYPKIKYHHNIYARVSGIDDMVGEISPSAEYDRYNNIIWIYYPEGRSRKWVNQTLLHEYTHYLQSPIWMKRYYTMGYQYDTHPYEIAAKKSESNWEMFT